MKNYCYLAVALVTAMFAGCQNENDFLDVQDKPELVFTACMDNGGTGARTAVTQKDDNTLQIVWSAEDMLSVFPGITSQYSYILTGESGKTNGNFIPYTISGGMEGSSSSASSSTATSNHVAFYPYTEGLTLTDNGSGSYSISTTLSATQTYGGNGTFSSKFFPMMAVTNGLSELNFSFKNIGSLIRLSLTGTATIDKLVLKSLDSTDKLAGSYTVTASNIVAPSVVMGNDAVSSITLNCPENGVTLTESEPTIFTFALMPTDFAANELVITIYDKEGKSMMYVLEEAYNLERNKSKKLEAVYSGEATTGVATETVLKTALENGGEVELTAPITLTENLTIDKDATINLNGQSLSLGANTITLTEGADLTLNNNATGEAAVYSRTTTEVTTGITSSSDIIKASEGSTITIGEGVELTTTGANSCCIWIPSGANNVTVNTAGVLKATTAGAAVISHNGNLTSGTINITGGSVIHEKDVAVYIAGVADLKISGNAEIKGTTGVEIRAGKLEVDGATITTESDFTEVANGNGTTITGAAIAVSQHTTERSVEVTIKNGTFGGVYALYEKDLQADPTNVTMSVTGGTFNGSIYSENCTSFITGGTFSDPSACQYLGTNANVTVNMTSDYEGPGFKTETGQNVTLNLGGKTYTATDPLVGSAGTTSQAFHLGKESTVSFSNGTLTSSQARMFMQNYATLTLNGVTLSPEIPSNMTTNTYYVLSNNLGEVKIQNGTKITAPTSDQYTVYAMDVDKYGENTALTVTVEGEETTISGDIAYTGDGTNDKLIINGGKFTGKLIVADTYLNAAKTGVSITGGTFSDASAFNYLANNANVSLGADMNITSPIVFSQTGVELSLNGKDIVSTVDAIEVAGGSLTISGEGEVKAGINGTQGSYCAVFAHDNATVNIQGGSYYVDGQDWNDCIYAKNGTAINISGGTFESKNTKDNGNGLQHWVLNCRGVEAGIAKSGISVTGGTFINYNPANNVSEGENTNYVAKGYKVMLGDSDATAMHSVADNETRTEYNVVSEN